MNEIPLSRDSGLRVARYLSLPLMVLLVVEALIGLLYPRVYSAETAWTRTTFQANDIVNLVVYLPLLVYAWFMARRESPKRSLLFVAVLALCAYDFTYYCLALVYGPFFLIYLSALGVSVFAFLFGLSSLDHRDYTGYIFRSKRYALSLSMIFTFAGILATVWLGMAALYLLTGNLIQEGVGLISTEDLVLLVVPLVLSGIWLIRKDGRGYQFGVILLLTCGLYSVILMAYTPLALLYGEPNAWGLFPLWTACFLIGTSGFVSLYSMRRTAR